MNDKDYDKPFCIRPAPGTCCPDMNEDNSIDNYGICFGCGKVYNFQKLKQVLKELEE